MQMDLIDFYEICTTSIEYSKTFNGILWELYEFHTNSLDLQLILSELYEIYGMIIEL